MTYAQPLRLCMNYFRRRRLGRFRKTFPPAFCKTIIDVGGTPDIWNTLNYPSVVTIVNTDRRELESSNGFTAVVGDGRRLPYPGNAFDLAFSNSVIEHVGDWRDMEQFAKELRRVGKGYYCQTPNKWFPIEPHLGTLFLHWFPWLINRYFVVRYLTLWGMMNRPTRATAAKSLSQIRLLSKRELKSLFPDANIIAERFMLLPKSYTAIRSDHCIPRPLKADRRLSQLQSILPVGGCEVAASRVDGA